MSNRTSLWRRLRIVSVILLAVGAVSLNGCIFLDRGHDHHHHDWH